MDNKKNKEKPGKKKQDDTQNQAGPSGPKTDKQGKKQKGKKDDTSEQGAHQRREYQRKSEKVTKSEEKEQSQHGKEGAQPSVYERRQFQSNEPEKTEYERKKSESSSQGKKTRKEDNQQGGKENNPPEVYQRRNLQSKQTQETEFSGGKKEEKSEVTTQEKVTQQTETKVKQSRQKEKGSQKESKEMKRDQTGSQSFHTQQNLPQGQGWARNLPHAEQGGQSQPWGKNLPHAEQGGQSGPWGQNLPHTKQGVQRDGNQQAGQRGQGRQISQREQQAQQTQHISPQDQAWGRNVPQGHQRGHKQPQDQHHQGGQRQPQDQHHQGGHRQPQEQAWGRNVPHGHQAGHKQPPDQQTQQEWQGAQKGYQRQQGGQKSNQSSTSDISEYAKSDSSQKFSASAGLVSGKGIKGTPIEIETNYITMNLSKILKSAYQYDIRFDPDKPKKLLQPAFMAFQKQVTPTIALAFDGKANVYSPCKLDDSKTGTFEVKASDPTTDKSHSIKVTLKETLSSEIDLKCLTNYKNDRIYDKPMRALQCLDVVLRSPFIGKSIVAGRAAFTKPERYIDLQDGYELWLGLFQSAVLGDIPFLNIDVCHKAFPTACNVMSLVPKNGQMNRYESENLYSLLKGINIIYKPPNGDQRSYKFNRIQNSASQQKFKLEDGREMTVEAYFREKGIRLNYPQMPCLWVGSSVRTIYVPMEFCYIPEGQGTSKKAGKNQVLAIIKHAATTTFERKEKILRLFRYFQHNLNPCVKQFQLQLGADFIKIQARIIDAPALEYNNSMTLKPRKGSWNMANLAYLQGQKVLEWAIVVTDSYANDFKVRAFADKIILLGNKMNMNITKNWDLIKIERISDSVFEQLKKKQKELVFVIIPTHGRNYASVKQNAEIRCGVLTQCIKTVTVTNKCNDSTITNILLKVNAKLNGINHKISPRDHSPIFNEIFMLIGADVTHPSPDQMAIPSVVGVVASHDEFGFQYNISWRLQDPKKEIIVDMEDILVEKLEYFRSKRKQLPTKIIYYRDGVSDGQFAEVQKVELSAMDRACRRLKLQAKLTCIIVQKRHHTRFFPLADSDIGKNDRYRNVPPGTIVDKTITHPAETQFFLVSHESIQGTAKPTKYCVIRDDSNLNIDSLQAMSFQLCHMFTRCNRSVSYPAPAYYAHLVAARGRVYIDGARLDKRSNYKREYEQRIVKDNIIKGFPMYFV